MPCRQPAALGGVSSADTPTQVHVYSCSVADTEGEPTETEEMAPKWRAHALSALSRLKDKKAAAWRCMINGSRRAERAAGAAGVRLLVGVV